MLYISDEVVTGFGRLGHWFASDEVFGITPPDIITCAKGMTSGYVPMGGAAIISDRLIAEVSGDMSQGGATFSNGYTYSGHPVSAAAALKNIEIIEGEGGILDHVRAVTPLFQDRLRALGGDHPIVSDARGMGLMGCVECSSGAQATLERDYALGGMIDAHCQANGLILRPIINMCVFSPPPLVMTEAQINQMFDVLGGRGGIQAAADDLARGTGGGCLTRTVPPAPPVRTQAGTPPSF